MQDEVWFIFDAESDIQSKPMKMVQVLAYILNIKSSKKKNIYLWTPGWSDWMSLKDFIASQDGISNGLQPPTPAVAFSKSFDQGSPILNPLKNSEIIETTFKKVGNSESKEIGIQEKKDSPYTEVSLSVNSTLSKDFNASELNFEQIQKIKIDSSTKQKISKGETSTNTNEEHNDLVERRGQIRHKFKIEIILMTSFGSFRTYSHDISLSGTQLVDRIPNEFIGKPFNVIIVNPFETNPAMARLIFPVKLVGNPSDLWRLQFTNQNHDLVSKLSALLNAYIVYQSKIDKKSS